MIAALGLFLLPPVSGHASDSIGSDGEEGDGIKSAFNITASASPRWGNAPLAVYFGSQISGGVTPYAFRWDLGDGSSVAVQNPNHTYRNSGRYVVRVEVTDSTQQRANSTPIVIDVADSLPWITAAGEGMPRHGGAPLVVQFRNWAAGGLPPYSFAWDFGDGSEHAWTSNPVHAYTSPGDYFASVTAFDSQQPPGADSSDLLPVTVTAPVDPLQLTATMGPSEGPAPLLGSFDGSAAGGTPPYSYFWDFGDGEGAATATATHVYDRVGEYSAVLVASDPDGRRGSSPPIRVKVGIAGGALAVMASAVPESGPAPLEVSFQAIASGGSPAYIFRWEFGDGAGGYGDSPTYIYRNPGIYLASVEVTDGAGQRNRSDGIQIRVGAQGNFTVSASAAPSTGPPPLTVSFKGNATGATEPRWEWTFGDGNRSIERDPVHEYLSPGNWWAVLTVTDRSGGVGSARVRIDVVAPAVMMLKVEPEEWIGEVGEMRMFVASVRNASGGDMTKEATITWERPKIGQLNVTNGPVVALTAVKSGNATLGVRATRGQFQAVSSARIEIRIPPPGPSVTITSPRNGSSVNGLVEVRGTVLSGKPVDSVEVKLGSGEWSAAEPVGPDWTEWRSQVDLAGLNGTHWIYARARAGGELSEEARVTVIVREPSTTGPSPPWGTIAAALAGAALLAAVLTVLWSRRRKRKKAALLAVDTIEGEITSPSSRELRKRAIAKAVEAAGSKGVVTPSDLHQADLPEVYLSGTSTSGARS